MDEAAGLYARKAKFERALAFVLAREGGYVNHPADRGGATNKGVTQATYDAYRKSLAGPPRPVKDITAGEIRAIYAHQYWTPVGCDGAPPNLATALFDAAVMHGPKRAIKLFQRAVGLEEDGVVGPNTTKALRDAPAGTAEKYIAVREEFFRAIVAHDSSQKVFLKGWLNRMAELKREVLR